MSVYARFLLVRRFASFEKFPAQLRLSIFRYALLLILYFLPSLIAYLNLENMSVMLLDRYAYWI
jgi:hypothetical protein